MMNVIERDKKYVIGTYNRFPINIVRGCGSTVYDENGKEYIDMGSGIGVTSFGISDGVWKEAVISQIEKVQHMSNLYYTSPCSELAELLCQKTGLKKVFFSNSGAEANECAIKLARKYAADKYGKERNVIVTLKNSFHGRTLTTLSATGQDHYHELYNPLTPGFESIEPGDMENLKNLAKDGRVAGILVECIQGEGGVKVMDAAFLKELEAFAKKNDILFMVDEVQTGNGRTGKLYSYMNFGLDPDVVSTAKGLAGGLPLGATLAGEKAMDVLSYGDHGSTFGGNPVCCAAALSILKRIDDDLLASVCEKGEFLRNKFQNVPGIESISGIGLMIGLKTTKPCGDVVKACNDLGVLCLTAKDKVRLLPALNISYEELEKAADKILLAIMQ